jgi:hypothetical protein
VTDRIVTDPEIMTGVPCVAGTRIPVATLVWMLAEDMDPAAVLADFPSSPGTICRRAAVRGSCRRCGGPIVSDYGPVSRLLGAESAGLAASVSTVRYCPVHGPPAADSRQLVSWWG